METQSPEPNNNNNNNNYNNNNNNSINNNNNNYDNNSNDKSNSRRGSNTHISMSDTESQTSQLDSFYSPLRFNSPTPSPNSKALVSVESPHTPPQPTKQVQNFSRGGGAREGVRKVERRDDGEAVVDVAERRKVPAASSAVFRSREVSMRKVGLGFRVCEVVLCLVSFSVMASDRTQGWSGDSYNRYKEYRYCLAVNVIGFVYAGFQAFNSACYLASGRHVLSYYLHYHFEFFMDQILAYLLMSASSSAATRVDDWVSNWGKDTFTEMATASVGVSFLAFLAFAISSLISGYNLCNRGSN